MKRISDMSNRVAVYGSFSHCNSLIALAALALLLVGCGGGNNPAAIPGEVTFAKSFGGPGREVAGDLVVDAEGRLVVAGIYETDAVGGTQTLPWVIGLDPLGNSRWQISPTRRTGVASGANYSHSEALLDGGALHAGSVHNAATGADIFLLRADADRNSLWTLELDSGSWGGSTEYGGNRRNAQDQLEAILGNETFGWFVIGSSRADIRVPGSSDGARLFLNTPSVVVWFVEPGGDVRWQQRIAATISAENPVYYLNGPRFEVATLAWDHRLAMILRGLDPASEDDQTLVVLDNSNNGMTAGPGNPPIFSAVDHPRLLGNLTLYQTSDASSGIIDPLRDDGFLLIRHHERYTNTFDKSGVKASPIHLMKLDRGGNESWRFDLTSTISNTAFFGGVAQTFPDNTPSWLWIGGQETVDEGDSWDDIMSIAVLWRFDLAGNLSRRCVLSGDQVYRKVTRLSVIDGGRNLRVGVYFENESGYAEWAELTVDENCVILSSGPNQTSDPIPYPPSSNNWWEISGLSLMPSGDVALLSHYAHALTRIDESGTVTRVRDVGGREYNSNLSFSHLYDTLGRLWLLLDRPFIDHFDCGILIRVDDQGRWLYHGMNFMGSSKAVATDDGGLDVIAGSCSGLTTVLPPGLSLVHIDADGRASAHALPGEQEGQTFSGLRDGDKFQAVIDVLDDVRMFSISSGVVYHYGRSADTRWSIEVPMTGDLAKGIDPIDAVIAHDGGMVLLMTLRAVELPAELTDPTQTYGDDDIALLKVDARGRAQWLRVFGAADNERAIRLRRTDNGYAVLAHSDSMDAVTPGSRGIWVLQTGIDGHIEANARGEEFCQACLGSLSGQALADLLPLVRKPLAPLPPAVPLPLEAVLTDPDEYPHFTDGLPVQTALSSQNTARQCFGDATDVQEAALGESGPMFGLSLTLNGSAGGTVSITPVAINCDGDCYEIFPAGSEIVLEDNTELGWQFEGFSGDADCSDGMLTMDADRHCDATFLQPTLGQPLSVTLIGSGQVQSSPPGINCGENCNQHFDSGSQVTLSATAGPGFTFSSWSDDCVEQLGAEATVTMDGPKNCSATFQSTIQTFSLTAATSGNGEVVSTPTGIDTQAGDNSEVYGSVTNVTLRGIPGVGQVFGNWACLNNSSGLNQGYSTPEIDITVDDDWTCTASFTPPLNPVELVLTVAGDQATITESIANLQCAHPGALAGPTVCSANYSSGTNFTLDVSGLSGASPRTDWLFACDSYLPTVGNVRACVYTISADTNIMLEVR